MIDACAVKASQAGDRKNLGRNAERDLGDLGNKTIYITEIGVSIWRYGAKNSASENFLAPRAVFFAAPDSAAAGNYELSDSLEWPCAEVSQRMFVYTTIIIIDEHTSIDEKNPENDREVRRKLRAA